MRQFKPLVLALFAVFAFGAVVVAGASARPRTPSILPIGLFTDKSGASQFTGRGIFGTAAIKCASSTSTGGYKTSLLGTFNITFNQCLVNELVLLLCTGLDRNTTSNFTVLGTFHLRWRDSTGTRTVIAFLLIPVHFECRNGGTELLLEWVGCAAGEITPVGQRITLPTPYIMDLKVESTATTRNTITLIRSEEDTAFETCSLLARQGTAAFSQLGLETRDEIFPSSTTSEIMVT